MSSRASTVSIEDVKQLLADSPAQPAEPGVVGSPVRRRESWERICLTALAWAAIVGVLRIAVMKLLRVHGPPPLANAPRARLHRTVLYLFSTGQAFAGAIYSLLESVPCLRASVFPSEKEALKHADPDAEGAEKAAFWRQRQRSARFIRFILGYLCHDLLMIAPVAAQYPADIVHHFIGISLIATCLRRPETLMYFVPHFLRLESSTVVLNSMWFVREYPGLKTAAPALANSLPTVFAGSFFVLRVVWLPYFLHHLHSEKPAVWKALGATGQRLMLGLIGLNWYWFGLIAKMVVK